MKRTLSIRRPRIRNFKCKVCKRSNAYSVESGSVSFATCSHHLLEQYDKNFERNFFDGVTTQFAHVELAVIGYVLKKSVLERMLIDSMDVHQQMLYSALHPKNDGIKFAVCICPDITGVGDPDDAM